MYHGTITASNKTSTQQNVAHWQPVKASGGWTEEQVSLSSEVGGALCQHFAKKSSQDSSSSFFFFSKNREQKKKVLDLKRNIWHEGEQWTNRLFYSRKWTNIVPFSIYYFIVPYFSLLFFKQKSICQLINQPNNKPNQCFILKAGVRSSLQTKILAASELFIKNT